MTSTPIRSNTAPRNFPSTKSPIHNNTVFSPRTHIPSSRHHSTRRAYHACMPKNIACTRCDFFKLSKKFAVAKIHPLALQPSLSTIIPSNIPTISRRNPHPQSRIQHPNPSSSTIYSSAYTPHLPAPPPQLSARIRILLLWVEFHNPINPPATHIQPASAPPSVPATPFIHPIHPARHHRRLANLT